MTRGHRFRGLDRHWRVFVEGIVHDRYGRRRETNRRGSNGDGSNRERGGLILPRTFELELELLPAFPFFPRLSLEPLQPLLRRALALFRLRLYPPLAFVLLSLLCPGGFLAFGHELVVPLSLPSRLRLLFHLLSLSLLRSFELVLGVFVLDFPPQRLDLPVLVREQRVGATLFHSGLHLLQPRGVSVHHLRHVIHHELSLVLDELLAIHSGAWKPLLFARHPPLSLHPEHLALLPQLPDARLVLHVLAVAVSLAGVVHFVRKRHIASPRYRRDIETLAQLPHLARQRARHVAGEGAPPN